MFWLLSTVLQSTLGCIYLLELWFSLDIYKPRNGIAGSYDNSIFSFFPFFFFFGLLWVFLAVHGFSLVTASGGYSLIVVHGLLIAVPSLATKHGH